MSGPIRLVGLTGSIAAGKSTVGRLLTEAGFRVVDADEIAKALLTEAWIRNRIIEMLGAECYDADGNPDRGQIARVIFGDSTKRKQLEELIHPLVRKRVKELSSEGGPLIYDVPLLFESGTHTETDLNVMIDAPLELRIKRGGKRNGWTSEEFLARESSQMPADQKRTMADIVIENDSDLETLGERLKLLIEILEASR